MALDTLPSIPDAPETPDAAPENQSLSLTPDQLSALGLGDCKPGESYTIKLTAGDSDPEGGTTFDVISAEPDAPENSDDLPPMDEPTPPADEPGSGDSEGDDLPLGFSPKKKTPREGLPDTKKMRDV